VWKNEKGVGIKGLPVRITESQNLGADCQRVQGDREANLLPRKKSNRHHFIGDNAGLRKGNSRWSLLTKGEIQSQGKKKNVLVELLSSRGGEGNKSQRKVEAG